MGTITLNNKSSPLYEGTPRFSHNVLKLLNHFPVQPAWFPATAAIFNVSFFKQRRSYYVKWMHKNAVCKNSHHHPYIITNDKCDRVYVGWWERWLIKKYCQVGTGGGKSSVVVLEPRIVLVADWLLIYSSKLRVTSLLFQCKLVSNQ